MTNVSSPISIPSPRQSRVRRALFSVLLAGGLVVPVANWGVALAVLIWHVFTMSVKGFRGAAIGVGTALLALVLTLAVVIAALSRAAAADFVPDFWLFLAGYGSVSIGTLALLALRRVALNSSFLARRA